MKTWLVEGQVAAFWDGELMRELEGDWPDGPAGDELRVGLVDDGGRLYRVIVAEGVREFAALAARLQDRGLRLQRPRREVAVPLDFVAL